MSSIAGAAVAEMAVDFKQAAQSLTETATQLARRWATQRLDAVQRYGRILADYGAGRASGRAAAEAYARLAMDEAASYPADAFKLATDYASAVGRAAGLSFGVARPAAGQPVLDIEMSGMMGGVATRAFVLENPHDNSATIRFIAANFVDGDHEVNAKPLFEPVDLVLPAHGEQAVSVSVKIDRRKFRTGGTYRSNVAVEGFDDMIVRVHLTTIDSA